MKILLILVLVIIVQTDTGELLYPKDKCTSEKYNSLEVLDCKIERYCKDNSNDFYSGDGMVTYTQGCDDFITGNASSKI